MDARLLYHNHSHTWEVTDIIAKIATHSKLSERDRFVVLTAGWFFDTGYFVPGDESYEAKSATLATDFLKSIAVDEEDINEIRKCITVTPIPEEPQTKTQEIVCDAICYYMGTKEYREKNNLLRKETEALTGQKIAGREWRARSIASLFYRLLPVEPR
jgi:predicted metal-dependent HD superfamily phosphohydrolase